MKNRDTAKTSTVSKTISSRRWIPRSLMRAARYADLLTPSVLCIKIFFLLIVHVFTGVHGRRSDRCSMTDAHQCYFVQPAPQLVPKCRKVRYPTSPFPIKLTLLLSWLRLQYNDCRQLVRTFRVLDLSTSVGFSHNLSAIYTSVHSRTTIQHDTRKEGYDNI